MLDHKRHRDNVHDFVYLNDIERGVIDTPEMQRLRHIKQLGFAYLIARVMLVPPKYLQQRFSSQSCVTFSAIVDLAKEFDVPISVAFERLTEDGYIPKYPGHVLLRYGVNEATRKEPKWRVAARSVPFSEFAKIFPVRNQSLDDLKIQLPLPGEMAISHSTHEFSFNIQASNWIMRIQHFELAPSPWLLVSIELRNGAGRRQPTFAQGI